MATDFGIDFASYPDMTVTPISGPRVVAEAMYRRFSMARGSNPFHPDDGLDLRAFMNESMTTDGLFALKNAIEREAEKDERVFALGVDLRFNANENVLTILLGITTAEGPFKMTLAVSQLTMELLFDEG